MSAIVAQVGGADPEAGLYALALVLVVSVIYLLILRFLDLNEKEPLWAMVTAFEQGFLISILFALLVTAAITTNVVLEPVASEVARFIGLAAAVGILGAVSRGRGWSEIGGVMDGIVYGAAVGLGFAAGETLVRELTFAGRSTVLTTGAGTAIWGTALVGLVHGLFGAVMGAGFGAAARARTSGGAALWILTGFVGAVVVHILYDLLRTAGAAGGSTVRSWIALALPLVLVLVAIGMSLRRERRAIDRHMGPEVDAGVTTQEELVLLRSFGARRGAYARAFMRGDFDYWLALRTLHNRQVQLALVNQRAAEEDVPERRQDEEAEAARLRADIAALRAAAEARRGRSILREDGA
ncbi:MAG TPA: PrsW family glutamic-type intramembrane protease [Actinomycetota bacterium]|nr:PrsW family glutamic-type intramembrane protease [Actinomycetota bacterium]